jgi:hypothetical protein
MAIHLSLVWLGISLGICLCVLGNLLKNVIYWDFEDKIIKKIKQDHNDYPLTLHEELIKLLEKTFLKK